MPPSTETGEIEKDLGLTPVTSPVTVEDAPDTGGIDAPQPSGGQDEPKADEPASMADAIAQALAEPKAEADAGAAPDAAPKEAAATPGQEQSTAPAEAADAEDDPSDEELKGYQPKVQKRIRKLLSQRNEYRREAETLKEDAGHYRNIREFMAQSQLQDQEVAELFEVGRLLKANDVAGYERALDIILPIANQLLEATGRSLPKDIREQVDTGELTEAAARELALQRTRAATAETRAAQVQQQVAQQQQVQQVSAHQTAVKTAVQSWEQRVRQSDPDFGLKADALRDAALALVAERGHPRNPEEAVQWAQVAYDRVSNWFSSARPAPRASRPAPGSGQNGNRSGLVPAPTSLADAIKGALTTR